MRREVASKAVALDGLLEGKASAFVHVHSAAMLSLVADHTTIKADVCPETLLFDLHRLGMLQREFQYLVAAVTMMVTAAHRLTATKRGEDLQALSNIANVFVPESKKEIDLEQTLSEIENAMTGCTLPVEQSKNLLKSLAQCASPTDAVHQLM